MTRRIKEFIEIKDHTSLDDLIQKLIAVRESLPPNPEAELRLRGDDVFGRKLTISYLRDQTDEEAEFEARYAHAHRADPEPEAVAPPPGRRKLRIVA